MGCPMFEKKVQIQTPKEYPFQSLYRPWSWVLSSFTNVAILLILLLLCYALFRRRKSQRRTIGKVPFRIVKTDAGKAVNGSQVKVLVTGGCGCFGQRLIKQLADDGEYEIHCLDLFIPDIETRPPGVASFISVDLTDRSSLELALKQVGEIDAVFHVAGLIPKVGVRDSDLYRVNKTGTQTLLDVCKLNHVKRFVFTSTCDVLISNDKHEVLDNVDESWPVPKQSCNGYCGSKKEAEDIVIKSNDRNGMATCSLRCSILADPDSIMFREILRNRGAYIGNGSNRLSIVDTDQCGLAHILAEKRLRNGAESKVAGKCYHIVGDSLTVKDMMGYSPDDSSITIWGHPQPLSIPKWLFKVAAIFNVAVYHLTGYTPFTSSLDLNAVEFLSRTYTFNGGWARRELGWGEQPSWKETFEKIVNEYEERLDNRKNK